MGELVIIMGYNAAGKTTLVETYTNNGFHRVNRDEIGGRLLDLPEHVEKAVQQGHTKVVMDNTYADVESRKGIIALAKKLGFPIKCVWLDTSFEDAQFNACQRQIRKHGRLLTPQEMKKSKDPNMFPPVALFGFKKRFQKPTKDEGFSEIEKVPFVRRVDPAYKNKALILDYDDTLRTTGGGEKSYPKSASEVKLLPGRKEKIKEYQDQGYLLLGVSNQSGIAKGVITEAIARECFDKTNELLGFDIEYHFCPHNIPPVDCFCRKPHPGNGVLLIEKHKLDRTQSIFVGDQTTDKTFAQRCGFKYYTPEEFFQC